MKKFLQIAVQFKTNACLVFTASVIVLLLVNLTGNIDISPAYLWEFLLISMVGSILQGIAFSNLIIKEVKYVARMALFGIPFLAFVSVCAVWFGWFPTEKIGYWFSFVIIFMLAFAGITLGFEIYYRVTGIRYNERLEDYKNRNKE